jgi:hypothetical protein
MNIPIENVPEFEFGSNRNRGSHTILTPLTAILACRPLIDYGFGLG